MTKVVEIECCQECPNFQYGPRLCSAVEDPKGEWEGRQCPDSKTSIPGWCPLDTPAEYAESNFNMDEEE